MGSAVLAKDRGTALAMWKMQDSPFFAIVEGKNNFIYRHDQDDINNAEAKLEETFDYIENSNSAAEFTIRVYDDGDKINNAKPYRGSVPFKLQQYNQVQRGNDGIIVLNQGRAAAAPVMAGTSSTDAKLDKLIELLTLKMAQEQEEEDEEDEDPEDEFTEEDLMQQRIQRWTTIGKEMSGVLTPFLNMILDRVAPVKNNISNTNISGMNNYTDEQVQAATGAVINLIGENEFRRVMVALGKMATENPSQLQMLIKMVN